MRYCAHCEREDLPIMPGALGFSTAHVDKVGAPCREGLIEGAIFDLTREDERQANLEQLLDDVEGW